MVQFSPSELESVHDYIQWLFPLPEPSEYNRLAPTLSKTDIAEFNADPELRRRLHEAFTLMLSFYGLEPVSSIPPAVRPSGALDNRRPAWITPFNHNYLRITRIIRSLSLLGLREDAAAFLSCLESVYQGHGDAIGPTTLEYWREAIVT